MDNKLTISEALSRASFSLRKAGIDQPRFEAELLLSFVLSQDRVALILNDKDLLKERDLELFEKAVHRRSTFEPVAYITGTKHFYGRPFNVTADVLVPRPETEMMVDLAVSRFEKRKGSGKVMNCLDLGTGSGILAISLCLELSTVMVWAVDISEAALKVAEGNARKLGVVEKIIFKRGSYYQALKGESEQKFDLIVANPPYVDRQGMIDLPKDVALFEPEAALYGGEDGLDSYRTICAGLKKYLRRPGTVLLEIGENQQKAVEELCLASGVLTRVLCHKDLSGKPRIIEGS